MSDERRLIYDIFNHAMSLIDKKTADYDEVEDHHSSFKYAQTVTEPFPTRYKSYAALAGLKLARLSQLLREGRKVNNEIVRDTFVDAINYIALMAERYELERID